MAKDYFEDIVPPENGGRRAVPINTNPAPIAENDACEGEKCTAVQKNLAVIEPELARAFGESFGPLSLERRFPDKLVLVADADVSTFLSQLFSRIDFTQFTATTVPFSVHVISAVELSPWLSMPEPMDTSLSIASALVNIERSTEA